MEKKDVYAYCRVSTDTQAEKGYGLYVQRNAIIKYCAENNLNMVEIFCDEGKSGTLKDKDDFSDRPDMGRLLSKIQDSNNHIKTVVVMNTSRLWRDEAAKVFIVREMRKVSGEIISIEQPKYSLYSNNPEDFLFNSMMEILDTYERMCINIRLNKGKTEKARQGYKACGRQPFGYYYDETKKNTLINPDQARIVKDIFLMRSTGISYEGIAQELNKRLNTVDKTAYTGIHKKNRWCWQSVQKILKNDYYIGRITYAGQKIDGKHKPIIDDSMWLMVS